MSFRSLLFATVVGPLYVVVSYRFLMRMFDLFCEEQALGDDGFERIFP